MKQLSLVVGGGEVRVSWDEDVPDLHVKLSLASVLGMNLANMNSLERGLTSEDDSRPSAVAVVDFASGRKPCAD